MDESVAEHVDKLVSMMMRNIDHRNPNGVSDPYHPMSDLVANVVSEVARQNMIVWVNKHKIALHPDGKVSQNDFVKPNSMRMAILLNAAVDEAVSQGVNIFLQTHRIVLMSDGEIWKICGYCGCGFKPYKDDRGYCSHGHYELHVEYEEMERASMERNNG